MQQRRRFKQTIPLQDRLTEWSRAVHEQADHLRPGPERDGLLKKARQVDIASYLNEWASSSGLPSPK